VSLYERVSISPDDLIAALQQVNQRWRDARLHKNDVTKNLTIHVGGEMVGVVDLLRATVDDF